MGGGALTRTGKDAAHVRARHRFSAAGGILPLLPGGEPRVCSAGKRGATRMGARPYAGPAQVGAAATTSAACNYRVHA
jgi:hypothetical protein